MLNRLRHSLGYGFVPTFVHYEPSLRSHEKTQAWPLPSVNIEPRQGRGAVSATLAAPLIHLKSSPTIRLSVWLFHHDLPTASLAAWAYSVSCEAIKHAVLPLVGHNSWMQSSERSYRTLAPSPSVTRVFGDPTPLHHLFRVEWYFGVRISLFYTLRKLSTFSIRRYPRFGFELRPARRGCLGPHRRCPGPGRQLYR